MTSTTINTEPRRTLRLLKGILLAPFLLSSDLESSRVLFPMSHSALTSHWSGQAWPPSLSEAIQKTT